MRQRYYEKLYSQHGANQARYLLSIQEEQYRRICASIESSHRMNHNLRHHTVTLQVFLQGGRVQDACGNLEQYLDSARQVELVELCRNPVVNVVVGHYRALALQKDIHFQIPDELSVSDIDLSVILSNLLENAIDAADCEE